MIWLLLGYLLGQGSCSDSQDFQRGTEGELPDIDWADIGMVVVLVLIIVITLSLLRW